MDFNSVWRKRQACVRCRQLKVRCEYASPTETTCVRCERSHTLCITFDGKKKNGSAASSKESKTTDLATEPRDSVRKMTPDDGKSIPDEVHAKEEHAVYLQRIIQDAQLKLQEIGISPLRRAIAAKLYTMEEAKHFYECFQSSPTMFPIIPLLHFPTTIDELDAKYPMLAIAIVSVVALNAVSKPQIDIQLYLDEILKRDPDTSTGLDQHLALAVICQFSLWHQERGMSILLQFHALTITLMGKLRSVGNFTRERLILHVGAVTILPYLLVHQFSPLSQMSLFFSDVIQNVSDSYDLSSNEDSMALVQKSTTMEEYSPHKIASGPLMEMHMCYQRAMTDITVATTIEDLKRVVETALTSIQLLENHMAIVHIGFAKSQRSGDAYNGIPESENISLTPLRPCYLIAKMKLVRAAANRCVDLRACYSYEMHDLLRTIIEQAAASGGQLFRSFAHIDAQFPFMPTAVYYYVAEALKIMQMMRFMAFAGMVEVDVRSDCLLQVVTVKWEDFVRVSTIARNSFMLLFLPLDTSNVKIGVLDKTNTVVGPGNMPDFQIYCVNGVTNLVQEEAKLTRDELLQLIDSALQHRDWSNEDVPRSETATAISFPTALKLLLTDGR